MDLIGVKDIVHFKFQFCQKSASQYCCCWSDDYDRYGVDISINPMILKGISDVLDEALADFKFNLQLANMKQELEVLQKYENSSCRIREVKGGAIRLS